MSTSDWPYALLLACKLYPTALRWNSGIVKVLTRPLAQYLRCFGLGSAASQCSSERDIVPAMTSLAFGRRLFHFAYGDAGKLLALKPEFGDESWARTELECAFLLSADNKRLGIRHIRCGFNESSTSQHATPLGSKNESKMALPFGPLCVSLLIWPYMSLTSVVREGGAFVITDVRTASRKPVGSINSSFPPRPTTFPPLRVTAGG